MQRHPPFVLVYAPSGVGKTTDDVYSFPTGLFAAAPGALDVAESVCGFSFKPGQVYPVETIEDAIKLIQAERKKVPAKRASSLVIDDFSFLAQQSEHAVRRKKSGWKMWEHLKNLGLEFRSEARFAGMTVIMNCWEQAPKRKDDGSLIKGGPMVPGKLPEQLPAMCQTVLRGSSDPMRKPWPGVYECRLDPLWVMKDRYNVANLANGRVPMNLREILFMAGFKYPRLFDWQEGAVVAIARSIAQVPPEQMSQVVNQSYATLVSKGIQPEHASWTCRDAMDRVALARAKVARQSAFIQ